MVRCIFRLAGRTKILKLPRVNVTDNKYHTIIIQRLGNHATLQVDYAGKVEGSTGGTNHLMNHGGGALFAGKVLNIDNFRNKLRLKYRALYQQDELAFVTLRIHLSDQRIHVNLNECSSQTVPVTEIMV